MECPFCNRPRDLLDRVFYENNNVGWFAFLNAPPHTRGHLILAALGRHGHCAQDFDPQTLSGLGAALCDVVQAIRECHGPGIKDVLLASLRGDVKHFHLHLLPPCGLKKRNAGEKSLDTVIPISWSSSDHWRRSRTSCWLNVP